MLKHIPELTHGKDQWSSTRSIPDINACAASRRTSARSAASRAWQAWSDISVEDGAPEVRCPAPRCDLISFLEWPIFGLSKLGAFHATEYRVHDGETFVRVSPTGPRGRATICDSDVLIYLISESADEYRRWRNPHVSRVGIVPRHLLAAVGRGTDGRHYSLLSRALERLQETQVTTNVQPNGQRGQSTTFNLIEAVSTNERGEREVTLPEWTRSAIIQGRLLSLSNQYFDLRGSYERFLYRVARKHVGSFSARGWICSVARLHARSGSASSLARFKFELAKSVSANGIPDHDLEWLDDRIGPPAVRFTRRPKHQ